MFLRKKVYKEPERGIKAFLEDPRTYIGFGLAIAPLIVSKLTGHKPEGYERAASVAAIVTGLGIFNYSFFRHEGGLIGNLQNFKEELNAAKKRKEWWKWYRQSIKNLKGIDIPNEKYRDLIAEAEQAKDPRKALAARRKVINLAKAYIGDVKYQEKILRFQAEKPEPMESEPSGEHFIVPRKAYSNLSGNQKLRVQYFLSDMEELLGDENTRREL